MADLPYYYGEKGSRKYLESLVPLIILVLIAVVLVGKTTNVFCEVPGLDTTLCSNSGNIRILIIGSLEKVDSDKGGTLVNAPELKSFLDGPMAAACNMQSITLPNPDFLTYAQAAVLKKNDLVILAGNREYNRAVREAISDYLKSGGKVVIIGDAATKDPNDNLVRGWGHMQVPIELKRSHDTSNNIPHFTLKNPIIRIIDIDNPINKISQSLNLNLSEVTDKPTCNNNLTVIDVNPLSGGVISMLTGEDNETGEDRVVPAVVEEKSIFGGGTVYYFSFDPGCSQDMWISTVQEMTGKQTCHLQ